MNNLQKWNRVLEALIIANRDFQEQLQDLKNDVLLEIETNK